MHFIRKVFLGFLLFGLIQNGHTSQYCSADDYAILGCLDNISHISEPDELMEFAKQEAERRNLKIDSFEARASELIENKKYKLFTKWIQSTKITATDVHKLNLNDYSFDNHAPHNKALKGEFTSLRNDYKKLVILMKHLDSTIRSKLPDLRFMAWASYFKHSKEQLSSSQIEDIYNNGCRDDEGFKKAYDELALALLLMITGINTSGYPHTLFDQHFLTGYDTDDSRFWRIRFNL